MSDHHKRKTLKFRQHTANEQWNTDVRSLQFVWNPETRELLIAIKNQHDTTTFPLSWRDSSDFADWLHERVNNQRNTRLFVSFGDGSFAVPQGMMLVYNQGWTYDELKIYFERYLRKYHVAPNAQTGLSAVSNDQIIHIEIVEDYVEDTHEAVFMFDEDGNEIPTIG